MRAVGPIDMVYLAPLHEDVSGCQYPVADTWDMGKGHQRRNPGPCERTLSVVGLDGNGSGDIHLSDI